MKATLILCICVTVLILYINCKNANYYQENLFNSKPHIEDSIIYAVPQFPRLCDNMEIEKKYVNIGDCELYCEIEGAGTPLVLIHGGPGGTHHCFHPWLSRAKDKFKIIYYDQRGCGVSDFKSGEGYSFEQTVDDLENLRKALKIDKWIVLGHSFGGGVAQYYTIKYPQHVMGQILVGSVPMMNKPELNATNENWFLNEQENQKINEIIQLISTGKLNYAQYFYNNDINGGWKRQNFLKPEPKRQAQMALYDIVFDKAFSTDFDLYSFEHAFDNCPVPTLICEGRYDSIWSAEKIPMMKKNHPQAKFLSFEKSSHNIYSDETELFVNTIAEWSDTISIIDSNKITEWKNYTHKILSEQLNQIASGKLFVKLIKTEGMASAKKFFEDFKKNNSDKTLFTERSLNVLAYRYLADNQIDLAIELFELNAKEYPQSWNVYDSLGEAYLKKGNKEKAKTNYNKSVELNPDNINGKKILIDL